MEVLKSYFFPITFLKEFPVKPDVAISDIKDWVAVAVMRRLEKNYKVRKTTIKTTQKIMGGIQLRKTFLLEPTEKRLNDKLGGNQKVPYTHIPPSMFQYLEVRYSATSKVEAPTEEETATLVFYLALISVAGKSLNKEVRTTKDMIFARMNGYSSPKEKYENRFGRYDTRKLFEKLKRLVSDTYNIEFVKGKQRGINFIVVGTSVHLKH